MTVFVGCEPGQRYGFSAGITGKAAVLDLTIPNAVTVGWGPSCSVLQPLRDNLLVLWHLDAIETFHGFYDPDRFSGRPRPRWYGYGIEDYHLSCCPTITPRGLVNDVSSVAVQAVAAVVEIPAKGLLYVTSGRYGSRQWTVHTATAVGVTVESLKDYRARVLKLEGV